jgi:hypothetical protein
MNRRSGCNREVGDSANGLRAKAAVGTSASHRAGSPPRRQKAATPNRAGTLVTSPCATATNSQKSKGWRQRNPRLNLTSQGYHAPANDGASRPRRRVRAGMRHHNSEAQGCVQTAAGTMTAPRAKAHRRRLRRGGKRPSSSPPASAGDMNHPVRTPATPQGKTQIG